MHPELIGVTDSLSFTGALLDWLTNSYLLLKVVIGFSIIIFVHELGHFLAAKWMGIRVDRFAVGFFYRLCGYRRGEGLTFGRRPNYKPEELVAKGWGETDYCLNALPFGGYVKMMGEDDIIINEQTGEMRRTDDPRAFTNKPVGRRMVVVSAGVVFNVLFAILLYLVVFLFLGKEMLAPVIGQVEPASPAARAGLLPGDRILAINGARTDSFEDVVITAVLANGPLDIKVERQGQVLDKELTVEARQGRERAPIGMLWLTTTRVSADIAEAPDPQGLRPGDVVTRINDQPVDNVLQVVSAFETCGGKSVEFTVERTDPARRGTVETLNLPQRPLLQFGAAPGDSLLGFLRRQMVYEVFARWSAAAAGLKAGDVIVQWGTVPNPLGDDITKSVKANEGMPIPVVVERDGKTVTLEMTPKRTFSLWGGGTPQGGFRFADTDPRPVVADVVPGTPAAALGLPRGAEILAVGTQKVQSWSDVFEALKAAAGTTVAIRYRSGHDEAVGQLHVPSSVVNELGLPPGALICAIGDETSVTLEGGKPVALPSTLAVRKLLEKNVGRTVPVEYAPNLLAATRATKPFTVRSDNTDPWQMRAAYRYDLAGYFSRLTEVVTAHGNPLRALSMGARQTGRELWKIYRIARSMASPQGRVSVSDVSGPVGIVRAAVQQAESYSELLFFLAYISVNLAVINFVPLPVVDGGLMVFLLLEKIRGRPLGLKVQVVTTLVGLGLIVLCFVLVTFQDIVKWVGGGM
jgi:regulator of sigma E protease